MATPSTPTSTRRPQTERALTDKLLLWLRTLPECHVRKAHGSGYVSGLPDLIGCYRGRCLAIEVKRPDQPAKLTANQRIALQRWAAAGALTGVVHSLAELQALLSTAENAS